MLAAGARRGTGRGLPVPGWASGTGAAPEGPARGRPRRGGHGGDAPGARRIIPPYLVMRVAGPSRKRPKSIARPGPIW
jgi:hypothetical protein